MASMRRMDTPMQARRERRMAKILGVKNKENFIIESCGACGSQFYATMLCCINCVNTILTSEKVNEKAWRLKKRAIIKARIKKTLDYSRST